jgi:hypothetical protein
MILKVFGFFSADIHSSAKYLSIVLDLVKYGIQIWISLGSHASELLAVLA